MDTQPAAGIVEIVGGNGKSEDRLFIKALTVEWRAPHSAVKAHGDHRGETANKTSNGITFTHNDPKTNDRIRELRKKGKFLRIARLRIGAAPVPSFCGGDRSYPVFRHELDFIRTRRDAMKLNHLWRKNTDVHSFKNAEIEDVQEIPGAGGHHKTKPRWSVTLRFDDHPYESFPSGIAQHPTTAHQLVGLCLSGGGIRSATFCLGFIRALFDHGLLRRVDYLSTVSGGGYLGSCMTALLSSELGNIRTKKKKPGTLWEKGNFPFGRPIREPPEIGKAGQRPGPGGAGGEGVKEVPAQKKPVEHLRYYSNYLTAEGNFIQKYVGPVAALARGFIFNLLLIAPFIILAAAILAGIYQLPQYRIGQVPVLFHMQTMEEALTRHRHQTNAYEQFVLSASKQLAGLSFSERVNVVKADPLLQREEKILTGQLSETSREIKSQWLAMATAPGAVILLMMLFAYGFMQKGGEILKDRFRFSYRLAWMMSAAAALILIQLFGAAILYWNEYQVPNQIAWISLLSFLGPKLLAGLTQSKESAGKPWVRIGLSFGLMALAPLILLFFTGGLVHALLNPGVLDCLGGLTPLLSKWPLTIYSIVILLFVTNHFMNINRISLHEFYRDRLCRAFLIQHHNAEPPQDADPFDAIMTNDRIRLPDIYEAQNTTGPYHIINTTLNQSKSLPPDEGRQEGVFRSGESFIFSKYWCGSEKTGYADTDRYQQKDAHLNLGTAMAISGAAANVGMGRNNLLGMRLLLGLLNVRLGYWALNPKRVEESGLTLEGESPGGVTAIREWLGMYARENRFINLSDGGHFDNLGVYEMLRRRCKYIIVADAEADPSMRFQGLAAIIRLAWIDFAIKIEIDVSDLRPDRTTHFSKKHCAVGTIHYPKLYESGQEEIGYLVYCKSSLTGTEPQHLHSYRLKNPSFPHQTTADQWYDEEQFEAYRELGYTVGRESISPAGKIDNRTNMEEAFNELKQHWHPSPTGMEAHSTRYANELNRIMEIVKSDANVRFMDAQMFPEWNTLVGHVVEPLDFHLWLPERHAEVRAGFYVCSLMIQLMENVYTDLNLHDTHDHPANRGWMNLFMHWAWSGMFRVTWTILACTFNGEFQRFCERHLHLSLGEIEVNEILKRQGMKFEQDGTGKFRPSPQTKEKLASHLNPFEIMKIEKLPEDQQMKQAELPERCFAFTLLVKDPLCEKRIKRFTFGFALTNHSGGQAHIGYFRIQDHLRRIGLGRLALGKLIDLLSKELSQLHSEKSRSELLDLITAAESPRKKAEEGAGKPKAESFSQLMASVKSEKREEYFKTDS